MREKRSEGYEWGVQYAKKKNRMRRAKRGNNMGIRRELIEKGTRIEGKGESMIGDE